MRFHFKNLGNIKEADIEIGDLTIISGKNNTGKTYLTYSIWGILGIDEYIDQLNSFEDYEKIFAHIDFENLAKKMLEDGNFEIDFAFLNTLFQKTIQNTPKELHKIFGVDEIYFKNANAEFGQELEYFLIDIPYAQNLGVFEKFEVKIIFAPNQKTSIYNVIFLIYPKNAEQDYDDKILRKEELVINDKLVKQVFKIFVMFNFLFNFQKIKKPFLLTAQRDAIHLFKNSINKHSRTIVRNIKRPDFDYNTIDNYAEPLGENIDFASSLDDLAKGKSFLWKENEDFFAEIEEILGVKYIFLNGGFAIQTPSGQTTPHFLASTSVRVLADLHFYLKYKAQKGDMLMIDEPELNLHPEAQIKIARLLVRLTNLGIKVWITTHSDYIVKEINNCVLLSNDFDEKTAFMQEYQYTNLDILQPKNLKSYIAKEDGTVEKVTINDVLGMEKTAFDDAIKRFNEVSDILFRILG